MSDHPGGQPAQNDDGPVTLRLAVLVLWIESAALGVLTLFEAYNLIAGKPGDLGLDLVLVGLSVVAALLLAQLGRWLVRRKAWARGPAIVLQLMVLPVSFFMVTGPGSVLIRILGALIALVALFCAGLLLAPASRLALTLR